MADPDCYTDVWDEPQNRAAQIILVGRLRAGFTLQLTLQPGDMTRYELSITPIMDTCRYTVSDDGRVPEGLRYVDRPFGVIVTLLNEGFAQRSAHVWLHELDEIPVIDLQERLGARHLPTAMAVLGALKAIMLGMED